MQNLGGRTKSIMVLSGVAYSNNRKQTFRIMKVYYTTQGRGEDNKY